MTVFCHLSGCSDSYCCGDDDDNDGCCNCCYYCMSDSDVIGRTKMIYSEMILLGVLYSYLDKMQRADL